jgi:hypothetical protein
MNRHKIMTGIAAAFIAAMFMAAPNLKAGNDVWNKRTTMVFTQPFEVPGGQTLPAGAYIFKLLDSPFDREVVQIFSADQNHLYATVLAIPNRRLEAGEETVIRFEERASGSPQAIKAWFHPGEKGGHEFVYPKTEAVELAKVTNEPVPYMPNEFIPEITEPTKTAQEAPVATMEKAPIKAVEPSGKEEEVAEAFLPPPVQTASLPRTASPLPLIGLIGLLSLGAGFGLRAIAKQRT